MNDRLDVEFYKKDNKVLSKLPSDIQLTELSGVANIINKKSPIMKSDKEKVIKYIEISDVDPITSEIINCEEMKIADAPKRAYFELQEGDIITAVSGYSTGTKKHSTAYITEEHHGYICSNGFRVIRPLTSIINPFYLMSYLRSNNFLDQVKKNLRGSTIPTISDNDLSDILIHFPDKEVQDKIGDEFKEGYFMLKKAKRMMNDSTKNIENFMVTE